MLPQKPPISEIIAIVEWCEPYILAEHDLPHTYGIMLGLYTLQPGVFCVHNQDLFLSFSTDIQFIWIVIIHPI